jgi:hypothetical protein
MDTERPESTEAGVPGIVSDLTGLDETRVADVAEALKAGDVAAEETLRRVAPSDGTQLLVAASFNSAL